MSTVDVWPAIHVERAALVADLESVDDARWDTPSLCDGWTVRDVLAHMTATARITPLSFFPKLVGSGFSFPKMQDKDIAIERGSSPADALSRFRSEVSSTKHPPGPVNAWLGEVVVHATDIRRPLGIAHDFPIDVTMQVADFYKGSRLAIGAKPRIAGLTLKATDVDWSHGTGPEVSGPMLSLVMAMAGRKAVLGDLSGEGVTTLASR